MVIGDGLIANKFIKYRNNDEIIIFASGVSNSKEKDPNEFEREKKLLSFFFNTDKKFIYFSTLLINYPCEQNSNYVKHKKEIEQLISKNFKNFLIFRLPNIIGFSKNRFTSFNFFLDKILAGDSIDVQKNTTRFFLDSDDIEYLLSPSINNDLVRNSVFNICLNNKVFIKDFVKLIAKKLNKEVILNEQDLGCDVTIDNSFFLNTIEESILKKFSNYNENLILKYCGNGL